VAHFELLLCLKNAPLHVHQLLKFPAVSGTSRLAGLWQGSNTHVAQQFWAGQQVVVQDVYNDCG
jgi:hypothetical protein